jgi:hypothetical protein
MREAVSKRKAGERYLKKNQKGTRGRREVDCDYYEVLLRRRRK